MKINVNNCRHIELKQVVDEHDGVLSIAEAQKEIPFNIKRVYYIYGLENIKSRRGFHAHKKLEQAIFCINGSFKLMADDGENKQYLYLNNPNQGIFIGRRLWHTMFEFSKDCIILALASDHYDESDYIREYENFIKYIKRVK